MSTVNEDNRAARLAINAERNARRKVSRANYTARNGSHRRAKELRREFGGAFGKSPERLFNFLAQGTGAMERRVDAKDTTEKLIALFGNEGGAR